MGLIKARELDERPWEKLRFETNVITRTLLMATVIVCMSTQSKTLIFQQITCTHSVTNIYTATHFTYTYFSRVRQEVYLNRKETGKSTV